MDADTQVSFVDIRMDGVGFSRVGVGVGVGAPFVLRGLTGAVSLCYLFRRGSAWLEVQSPRPTVSFVPEGAVIGLSGLIPHWFKAAPTAATALSAPMRLQPLRAPASGDDQCDIIVGHAPIEVLAQSTLIAGVTVIPPGGPLWRRIWRAMEAAEEELTDDPPRPGAPAAVRRCAELMLLNITRWIVERAAAGDMDGLSALGDPRLMRALAAAARDPLRNWTLGRMAQIAGMSRTAFAARFHQLTGASPLQTVVQMRLRRAAAELAHTASSVEEIAARAGYGSSAAFIRAFSRAYALPPARWRAWHLSAPPLDARSILPDAMPETSIARPASLARETTRLPP
jgi:AraC-like DNA-binding protein